jgi:hypothetical protein
MTAWKSRVFNLVSSLKKIRQAPGRLLREKLVTLSESRRSGNSAFKEPETSDTASKMNCKSGNPAFKGPKTLDMALDSLHRK